MKAIDDGLAAGALTWLVTGDATLLVDRAAERLVAWGRERCGPPQFNLSVFHASDASATEAFAAARTLPMMAGLRVVVVREIDQGSDDLLAALLAYAAEPSPSTLLVVCGSGLPKTRKGGSNWGARVPKALGERGRHLKLASADVPPVAFVREHARSLGKELGPAEGTLLVELVGADLSVLAHEVEKLALYVGDDQRIGAEAVQAASSLLAEAVVWDLTTGIAARDARVALASLHRLLEDGDASHRLLGLVVWQLRQVLQVAELSARGANPFQIGQAVRMHTDKVRGILKRLGDTPPDTAGMLERVARANRAMNSHRAGDRRVFEALVLELCA